MKELQLKYGCNPNQKPSKIYMADGSELRSRYSPEDQDTSTSWMPLMAGSWYVILRKQPDFRQQLHLSMYLRQVLPSDFR